MIRKSSTDVIAAIGNSWADIFRAATEESNYVQQWDYLYGSEKPEFFSYLTKEDFAWVKTHLDLCRR